jgi:threonine dehydratase
MHQPFHIFKKWKPTSLDQVGLFVDGCAVKRIGEETFKISKNMLMM